MKLKRFIASILLLILIGGTVSFFAWATAGFKDKSFGPVKKAVDKIQKKEPEKNKEVGVAPNVLLKGKDISKNIDEVLSGQMKQVMFRGATKEGNVKKVQLEVVAEPVNAQAEITARLLFKGTKTTKNSKGEDISKYLTMNPIKTKGVGLFEIVKKQTFEEEAVLELKAGGLTYEITIGCLPDEFDLTHDFVKAGRINVNADMNKSLFEFNLEKAINSIGKSLGTHKDKYKSVIKYATEIEFDIGGNSLLQIKKYLKKNGYEEIDKIFTFKSFIGMFGSKPQVLSGHDEIVKRIINAESDFMMGLYKGVLKAEINEKYCNGNMLKFLSEIFQNSEVSEQEYKEEVRDFYNTNGTMVGGNKSYVYRLNFNKMVLNVGEKEINLKQENMVLNFPNNNFDLVGIDNPVIKITGTTSHIDV